MKRYQISLPAFLSLALFMSGVFFPTTATAELKMSAVFGSGMVLQREMPVHVWGWTTAGQEVVVSIGGNSESATAGEDGRFDVKLPAMVAGGPHVLEVKSDETSRFEDVLVGEVWLCSGQSNMQWDMSKCKDADIEIMTANFPDIRLISVPRVASQDPQNSFDGQWQKCAPETVGSFSAVGYYFGRQLNQTLDVPIGLIDNSWGGSACEAWVSREVMESGGKFDELLQRWDGELEAYDYDKVVAKYEESLAKWKKTEEGRKPNKPRNKALSHHRPANLYNGVLHPVIGYTIRGAIWYQGETNSGRAYQYRELFPTMIQNWRDDWGQGDFPFYWVQLADYRAEKEEPTPSDWAELREAQTMTMSLKNTGEAVIIDLGEAEDIHPLNKQDVAMRLSRWALANDYGYEISYHSPMYREMSVKENRIQIDFDHVGGGLDTFDVRKPIGFQIAADGEAFVFAQAKIIDRDTIEVWSDEVSNPADVRYAWADNPVCNVRSKEGLPLTPFRSDSRKGVTEGVNR